VRRAGEVIARLTPEQRAALRAAGARARLLAKPPAGYIRLTREQRAALRAAGAAAALPTLTAAPAK
jgi:Spy/CpxP family protein refolding chaperone